MSEMNEPSYPSPEGMNSENSAELQQPLHEEQSVRVDTIAEKLESIDSSIDDQSYPLGEVPQMNLLDPEISLPLNSDLLNQPENNLQNILDEVELLIEEEIKKIQKFQTKIDQWEDRIEKNKASISENSAKIKQNNHAMTCDKKNYDYWLSRAEEVELDYQNLESAAREEDWSWLIKKYGLKNPDGSEIDPKHACVEELCNGGCKNLAGHYRYTANKYDELKKDKQRDNTRLIKENSRHKINNDTLQRYIHAMYEGHVEPIQSGIVLFKEFSSKLKSFSLQKDKITLGDLRQWSELFLDEFLVDHPTVNQSVVSDFRRMASIPLPSENW